MISITYFYQSIMLSLCKAINKKNTLQQFMNTAPERITATSHIQQKNKIYTKQSFFLRLSKTSREEAHQRTRKLKFVASLLVN